MKPMEILTCLAKKEIYCDLSKDKMHQQLYQTHEM